MLTTDDLCVDLTIPTKERKKKCLPKIPKEIMPIKCSDKVGSESWNEERAKNIGNFSLPSRILLLGPCAVGKSCLIKLDIATAAALPGGLFDPRRRIYKQRV